VNVFAAHVCFSKVSWARRLKARAATVLSRCGAVMPQVQWEQPQPVNSSPSTQIKRLFIHLPQSMHLEFELGRGEAEHINASSAEGGLLPAEEYFLRNRRETK